MEVTPEDARAIFLDWTLGPEAGPQAVASLLARYAPLHPAHPMTALLRAAAEPPPAPSRRGGARGRR